MATEKEVLLIDIKVEAGKALADATAQKKAIQDLKMANADLAQQNKELSKDELTNAAAIKANTQAIILNEAQIKSRTLQLNADMRVLQDTTKGTTEATGAYKILNDQYRTANQLAKDLAVAYGSNSKQAKEVTTAAKKMSDQLKEVDDSVGQNQRNVGNYSSILGMLPGGFGKAAMGAQGFGTTLKVLSANPILLILGAIVGVVVLLSNAFSKNGEAVKKMNQLLAPFKTILEGAWTVLGKVVEGLIDGALAIQKFVGAIGSFITGQTAANTLTRKTIDLEKERQLIAAQDRQDIIDDAKIRLSVGELRQKITRADLYSAKERLAFAKQADAEIRADAIDDANRLIRKHNNLLAQYTAEGKAYKDLTKEQKDELAQSEAAAYDKKAEYFEKTRRLNSNMSKAQKEIEVENAKAVSESIANREKRREDEIKKMETNLQIAQAKELKITSAGAYATWEAERAIIEKKVKFNKLTEEEATLARLQADNKYRDTINALNKKGIEDEKEKFAKSIELENAYYDEEAAISKSASDKIVEQNKVTASKELEAKQIQLDNEYYMAEGDINRQLELTKKKLELQKAIEITAADGNAALILQINEKYRQLEGEATATAQQKKQAKFMEWANMTVQISTNLNELVGAIGQADLARYEKENKGKIGFEEAYAKKKAKLEHDAAVRAKAISVMTTIVSTAQSIMAALAIPLGAGVPLAIANGVAGAIQLATILATPVPGGDGGGGGGSNAPSSGTSIPSSVPTPSGTQGAGLVNRTSEQAAISQSGVSVSDQVAQGMSKALKDNPIQPTLVLKNVTDAQAETTRLKTDNSL